MIIELVREPISVVNTLTAITGADCGAVLSFLGVVRNHNHGREVLRLEYTAYDTMALAKMKELANTVRDRWPVQDLAIVHRLGTLEVGEASILVALTLAHRAEGFEALRYAVDTFKQTIPIWKKEHFANGQAKWVEGS